MVYPIICKMSFTSYLYIGSNNQENPLKIQNVGLFWFFFKKSGNFSKCNKSDTSWTGELKTFVKGPWKILSVREIETKRGNYFICINHIIKKLQEITFLFHCCSSTTSIKAMAKHQEGYIRMENYNVKLDKTF